MLIISQLKANKEELIFIDYFTYFYRLMCLLGEGNGTPLQYSCLENPMDGGT